MAEENWLERARGLSERTDRVDLIRQLMVDGSWVTTSRWQRKELARLWGIGDDAMRSYSAEAHRHLSLPPEERKEMRIAIAARMGRIAERARTTLNGMTGMPDFKAEIEAVRLMGEYLGVKAGEIEPDTDGRPSIEIKLITDEIDRDLPREVADRDETDPDPGKGPPDRS